MHMYSTCHSIIHNNYLLRVCYVAGTALAVGNLANSQDRLKVTTFKELISKWEKGDVKQDNK